MEKNDYLNMLKIIDAMASRGAIKGEELFAIGVTRQRLVSHVEDMDKPTYDAAETVTEKQLLVEGNTDES